MSSLQSITEEAANGIADIQSRMEGLTKNQIAQELEIVRVRLLTPAYTLYEDQDNYSSDTQAYPEHPIK